MNDAPLAESPDAEKSRSPDALAAAEDAAETEGADGAGSEPSSDGERVDSEPSSDVDRVDSEASNGSARAKRKAPKRRKSLVRDALSLAAFLATALGARASLADHYVVPTGSMIPTVHEGDRVFVSKAAYGLRVPMSQTWLVRWAEPRRGDVVVLDSPDEDQVLLKRVVALAGDTVEVRGGKLILNGERVVASDHDETLDGKHHALSLASGGGPDFGPSVVPAGKVLVMGDNRGNSRDGRYFGFIEESSVLGHALAVYARDGSLVWDAI